MNGNVVVAHDVASLIDCVEPRSSVFLKPYSDIDPQIQAASSFRPQHEYMRCNNYLLENVTADGSFRYLRMGNKLVDVSLYGISTAEIDYETSREIVCDDYKTEKVGIYGFIWTATNFYHWLTQILPSIEAALRTTSIEDAYLVTAPLSRYQEQSLEYLGLGSLERVVLRYGEIKRFPRMHVSSYFNTPTVESRHRSTTYKKIKSGINLLAGQTKRIYVSRQDASVRRISNEDSLCGLMREFGFSTVCPGQMTLEEQVRCFHNAYIVAGPHGQGLTHVAYCSEGTVVYEFMPHNYPCQSTTRIAYNNGLRYVAENHPQGEGNPQTTDMTVDLDKIRRRLETFGYP